MRATITIVSGDRWSVSHPRRKVRAVGDFGEDIGGKSAVEQKWKYVVKHGGTVANKYAYRAVTECALYVADPWGRVCEWRAEVPANKATLGGAAEACLPGSRALWDGRYGVEAKQAARDLLRRTHAEVYAPIVEVEIGSELHIHLDHAFAALAGGYYAAEVR